MGFLDRARSFDRRWARGGQKDGESRREFLERRSRGTQMYIPRQVYEELVELHDRVARLETALADRPS
jgi:hypothetical protein